MASLLIKKLTSEKSLLFSRRHNLSNSTPLFHFSTRIQQRDELPFMAQYLMSSFGFSEDRALKVTNRPHRRPIKTPDRPESVVRFLKENGLTDKDIQSVISWYPQILFTNVEKTLKPRANELIAAGFGGKTFIQLITLNPLALNSNFTLPGLQFWAKFVGNSEEALLKVFKRNPGLMSINMNKIILPRINLLREYGLSDQQIATLVMKGHVILKDMDSIKLLLKRTENLGFQIRSAGSFVRALSAVAPFKKDTLERKFKFFKNTFCWSEQDLKFAIQTCPNILTISEENVKSTMGFLITKFGFDVKSVALQPVILTYSLKRRLVPRDYVINVLKSKGLEVNYSSVTVIVMSETKFVEKFIVPYKEELPELGDSYAAFYDGKIPA